MPAIVVASIIGAGAAAGSTVYAAKKSGSAARKASSEQSRSNDAALAFERENEERRRQEFDLTEAENARRFDAAVRREDERWANDTAYRNQMAAEDRRRYENHEKVRTPYRTAGQAALADLDARRRGSMADLTGGVGGV